MSGPTTNPPRWLAVAACVIALSGAARIARADVNVGLSPPTGVVQPGTEVVLDLTINIASSTFNGFSVVVGFDPSAFTFVPAAPVSLQQGCLMTGGCSAACGNTFHDFSAKGDSIVINDFLLCNLVSIKGPGQLYKLRFRAGTTPTTSNFTIRRATFYNAGLIVEPVHTADAALTIPLNLAVGDGAGVRHPLRIEPNPGHGRLQLVIDDGGSGPVRADILDLQGRIVRSLGSTILGPRGRLDWDGTDRDGKPAPDGLYLARIERGGAVQTARFVLLR
jgi:hypothetical protein